MVFGYNQVLSAQNWKKVEHFCGFENLDLKGFCHENPDGFYTFKQGRLEAGSMCAKNTGAEGASTVNKAPNAK